MQKRKLIYILSPSYSGSTLLTMLMARHPQIATIGELKATSMGELSEYTCSCGELINNCAFWNRLIERLKTDGCDLNLENFLTHFSSNRKLANKLLTAQIRGAGFELVRELLIKALPSVKSEYLSILDKNNRMINAICDLQDKSVFLDGSKDPQRLLYFYRAGLWDINVIKMYRDGRAQCNSNRQKVQSNMDYAQSAHEWKWTIEQMDWVISQMPEAIVHNLKYEDLATNPNKTMKSLWSFLNLEEISYDWTEVNIRDFDHHILGNNMRTKDTIYISLDEGWKDKVTKDELNDFESIAGQVNADLGYR